MKKYYKKPDLVIKQYKFITSVMEEKSNPVYNVGKVNVQYTLGSFKDELNK